MASLVNNLGGEFGFGENYLNRTDDSYTSAIDISSVFTEGLNFFGTVWDHIYINNNGNITFNSGLSSYTPGAIGTGFTSPIIAPFWADVDTRATTDSGYVTPTPGGNSAGTNLTWYDLDPENGTITITWDDVGYYSRSTDKLNAFQLQLVSTGGGDFQIIYRYEDINWTTGDASNGVDGLGGTVARAGFSAGDGVTYYEFYNSGSQGFMLDLENTLLPGATEPGVWSFNVNAGAVAGIGREGVDDDLTGDDASNIMSGASGNDTLRGQGGDDLIDGGLGNDTLFGDDGNDSVYGGDGNDIISGGRDRDLLAGQGDDDIIYGNSGADIIRGNAGDDTVYGGAGNDRIAGNSGADNLNGQLGDDRILGGLGNDRLVGNSGNDTLFGQADNDRIFGGEGDDRLVGGAGADRLLGHAGADILIGNTGRDVMSAGEDDDRDVFVFNSIADSLVELADRLVNFDSGEDVIDLRAIDANVALAGDQAFLFAGFEATANAVWQEDTGPELTLYGDVDGDAVADFAIQIAGIDSLQSSDILL